MKPSLALAMGLIVTLAGCAGGTQSFTSGDGPAPAWSITDTNGMTHSQETAAGKPALLFFMATWCGKCQATAPRLADLHADGSANFYTISWDPQESKADLENWKTKYHQDWPHATDPGAATAQTFGITSQSSIAILDGSGHLVKRWTYAVPSLEELRAALADAATR